MVFSADEIKEMLLREKYQNERREKNKESKEAFSRVQSAETARTARSRSFGYKMLLTMQVLSPYVVQQMREKGEIAQEGGEEQTEIPWDSLNWITKRMQEDGSGGVVEDPQEKRMKLSRKRQVVVLRAEKVLKDIRRTWWKQRTCKTWMECVLSPYYEGFREGIAQQNADHIREATVRFLKRKEDAAKFPRRDQERISAMLQALEAKK